jgi:hypothetical protein
MPLFSETQMHLTNAEAVRLVMTQIGSIINSIQEGLEGIALMEDLIVRKLREVFEQSGSVCRNNLSCRFVTAIESRTFDESSLRAILVNSLAKLVAGCFARSGTDKNVFLGDLNESIQYGQRRYEDSQVQQAPFAAKLDEYRRSESAVLRRMALV